MAFERAHMPWDPTPRGRRNAVFALALALHVSLVLIMLQTRMKPGRAPEPAVVEATIRLARPAAPPPRPAAAAPPSFRVPRPPPRVVAPVRDAPAVIAEPQAITLPPPAPASAASSPEPLRLTLSRDQLRALIAQTQPTLAQSLARGPAPSALSLLGGDTEVLSESPLPGGVTEVHVHGGCFRLVPTPRSQYDPFNHGGERLTASCP